MDSPANPMTEMKAKIFAVIPVSVETQWHFSQSNSDPQAEQRLSPNMRFASAVRLRIRGH